MALTYTPSAELGSTLPSFRGSLVDGALFESDSIRNKKIKVIVFICGHCPYVQAIESRLVQLGHRLLEIDGAMIGICSNDAAEYPEDSPAELLKRSINKNYSFKYLIDEDQSIARRFGAVCTPDFFVYDQNNLLFYRGRLDDSWRNSEKVKNEELWLAIQRHLSGQKGEEQIPAMGCSIKWKAKK